MDSALPVVLSHPRPRSSRARIRVTCPSLRIGWHPSKAGPRSRQADEPLGPVEDQEGEPFNGLEEQQDRVRPAAPVYPARHFGHEPEAVPTRTYRPDTSIIMLDREGISAATAVVPVALRRLTAQLVDDHHVRAELSLTERVATCPIADLLRLAVCLELLAEPRPTVRQFSGCRGSGEVAQVTGQAIPVTLHGEAEPVFDLQRRVIVRGGISERHFVRLQRTD